MTAAATTLQPARNVFRRNWLVYKRIWYRSIFFGFLQPFMFLTAMGVGLGTLMDRGDASAFGGVSYIAFLGPGLMGATTMQTATFESTYPIMNKIMWGRNYEAMLATPLATRHILAGELGWISFRVLTVASILLVVLAVFGIPASPLSVLALPIVVLIGVGFSASLIAFTATQKNDVGFSWIFRFVINPLFLFSGTFFPLTQLPEPLQVAAWLTPLFHGVELIRGIVLERLNLATAPFHLLYLVAFVAIGVFLADRNLRRRMEK